MDILILVFSIVMGTEVINKNNLQKYVKLTEDEKPLQSVLYNQI
jgi:hypothetical protein